MSIINLEDSKLIHLRTVRGRLLWFIKASRVPHGCSRELCVDFLRQLDSNWKQLLRRLTDLGYSFATHWTISTMTLMLRKPVEMNITPEEHAEILARRVHAVIGRIEKLICVADFQSILGNPKWLPTNSDDWYQDIQFDDLNKKGILEK